LTTNRFAWVIAAALATACGGTEEGGSDAQVQAYEAARGELAAAVATYQADASAAQTDEGCRAAEVRYGAAAGPALERMREMSGARAGDGQQMHMQMMGAGDLACGADAIAAELARHQGVACAGDVLQDRAEAEHHAGEMGGWLEQQQQRCRAMQGDGTEPGACQLNPDGSYGIGPCPGCGDGTSAGCTAGTCTGSIDGTCPGCIDGNCAEHDGDGPHVCDGTGPLTGTEPVPAR
jgi:hypothetical protein